MTYKRDPDIVARECRMQKALDALRSNRKLSIKRAAKTFDVSRTSLGKRAKGQRSRCESREAICALSSVEEEELVRWIYKLSCTGFAPKHELIREMAEKVRQRRLIGVNDESIELVTYKPLGNEWVANFIERHSDLKTVTGHAIEKDRVEGTKEDVLRNWFNVCKAEIHDDPNVLIENVYNFDETGFSIGAIKAGRVVINVNVKNNYRARLNRQEWVSVIECIGADGTSIPPYILFKGKNINGRWFPDPDRIPMPLGWQIASSANGWTSNVDACNWIRVNFERYTCEKAQGRPRVLICDGHGSHMTGDFIEHCMQNNIKLLILPPHSSHYTQPLDIGVFSPVKEYLSQEVTRIINSGAATLQKVEWLEAFIIAREKGFSQQNILGSWNGAGLVPWNPHKVMRRVGAEYTPPPPTIPSPIMATPSPRSFFKDILMSPVNPDNLERAGNMVAEELEQKGHVNTPMRKFIKDLTARAVTIEFRNAILTVEKEKAEAVLGARRKRESGIRGLFKGVHSIASEEFLERVRDHEKKDP